MTTVTLYHNPRCRTSRTALELLRKRGIEPQIIEYREPFREVLRFTMRVLSVGGA